MFLPNCSCCGGCGFIPSRWSAGDLALFGPGWSNTTQSPNSMMNRWCSVQLVTTVLPEPRFMVYPDDTVELVVSFSGGPIVAELWGSPTQPVDNFPHYSGLELTAAECNSKIGGSYVLEKFTHGHGYVQCGYRLFAPGSAGCLSINSHKGLSGFVTEPGFLRAGSSWGGISDWAGQNKLDVNPMLADEPAYPSYHLWLAIGSDEMVVTYGNPAEAESVGMDVDWLYSKKLINGVWQDVSPPYNPLVGQRPISVYALGRSDQVFTGPQCTPAVGTTWSMPVAFGLPFIGEGPSSSPGIRSLEGEITCTVEVV